MNASAGPSRDRLTRFAEIVMYGLLVTVGVAYACGIARQRFIFGQADASNRLLVSFYYARAFWHFIFSDLFFNNAQNPGHFAFQGLIVKVLLLGGAGTGTICKALLLASVLAWAAGIILMQRAVNEQAGALAGATTGIVLVGVVSLLDIAPTSLSEPYTFTLLAGALLCMFRALNREGGRGLRWAIGAGLIAMATTTFRSEVFVLVGAMTLICLARRRPVHGLLVSALGSLYFVPKVIYILIKDRGRPFTPLNWGRQSHLGDPVRNYLGELYEFSVKNGLHKHLLWAQPYMDYLAIVAIVTVALVAAAAILRRERTRSILAPMVPWALLAVTIFAFISYELLKPDIPPEFRYMFQTAAFLATTLAVGLGVALTALRGRKTFVTTAVSWAAIGYIAWLAGWNSVYAATHPTPAPPRDVIDSIRWINTHNDRRPVAFDSVGRWEQPMLLYTCTVENASRSFCFSFGKVDPTPQEKPLLLEAPRIAMNTPENKLRARDTAAAAMLHHSLLVNRPKFLVIPSPDAYGKEPRDDLKLVYPYLKQFDDKHWRLVSPFLKPEVDVELRPEYKTNTIWVCEVTCRVEAQNSDPSAPTRH